MFFLPQGTHCHIIFVHLLLSILWRRPQNILLMASSMLHSTSVLRLISSFLVCSSPKNTTSSPIVHFHSFQIVVLSFVWNPDFIAVCRYTLYYWFIKNMVSSNFYNKFNCLIVPLYSAVLFLTSISEVSYHTLFKHEFFRITNHHRFCFPYVNFQDIRLNNYSSKII